MKIIKLTQENWKKVIHEAQKVLQNDGLVVFPSDTVYGLAAQAQSEKAVTKLLTFKDRPRGQAISIAVTNIVNAEQFVEISKEQEHTLRMILPGSYTIVLPSRPSAQLDKRLLAEDGTLGIRIPFYPFITDLSNACSFPYTSTSANIHARGPHYSIEAFLNTLSEKKKALLDLVIDYGELPHHLPSTIVNLSESKLPVLRKGETKLKLIKKQITDNSGQTKKLAKDLIRKYEQTAKNQPIIFILQGDLGAGKTVFSQGVGEYLGTEHVTSPTFVLYYEYLTKHAIITKLHHFDLYRAENATDLEVLGIQKLLLPQNVLIFEWGERIGSVSQLLGNTPATVVYVTITEIDENKRSFFVYEI